MNRPGNVTATLCIALVLVLGGCRSVPGTTTERDFLLVETAASRLSLEIAKVEKDMTVLRDGTNTVVLFPGPSGRAWVNSVAVGPSGDIVRREGRVYVAEDLLPIIHSAMQPARTGPARPPPISSRPPPTLRPVDPTDRASPVPVPPVRDLVGRSIVIDAGHGGRDPGATAVTGTREKTVNIAVARRTAELLLEQGARVGMTRTTDVYLTLEARADLANRLGADLFVSLHSDSSTNAQAKGFTVFVAQNASAASVHAAKVIAAALEGTGVHSRGVRRADFRVLVRTRGPAVLVEMGFLTNAAEAARLDTAAHRERLARGVAKGIAATFSAR